MAEEAWSVADREAMALALAEAGEAAAAGEVPVGAVLVSAAGEVLGRGRNRREARQDITAHAELEALRQASANVGSWRLDGCRLFVTLEPCHMCAAACRQARVAEIVFATRDPKTGALFSVDQLYERPPHFHDPLIREGLEQEAARQQLRDFFASLRRRNRRLAGRGFSRGALRDARVSGVLGRNADVDVDDGTDIGTDIGTDDGTDIG
ncbi:MAG: nucleoside deaminase [Bacillota bacterium]|nr:nucleoside deaminase [Bacillota bacterium]